MATPGANLTCCYCLETLVIPVLLSCGHRVCLTCVEKLIDESNQHFFKPKVKSPEEQSEEDEKTVNRVPSAGGGEDATAPETQPPTETGEEPKEGEEGDAPPQKKKPVEKWSKIKCPVCWQDTTYETKRGIEGFEKDRELQEEIEAIANPKNESICEVCEEKAVEYECETQCGEICSECHQNLHRGRFKMHRVVEAKVGRAMRELSCGVHQKDLDVYCYTCEQTVCQMCSTMGEHARHECQPLIEAYEKEIQTIEGLIKARMEHNISIRQGTQEIDTTLVSIEENHAVAREAIQGHFEELAKQLDRRKDTILSQLDQLKGFKAKKLTQQHQQLNDHYDHLYTTLGYLRTAMQKTSRRDVMGVRSLYTNRLQSIPLHPTPVDMVETGTFQYLLDLKEDVAKIETMGNLEFAPRVTGTLFPYKGDFDTHGVLFWIGKQYGTAATYTNPAALGLVTVTSSSVEYGNPEAAIQHNSHCDARATFMSADRPGSWLCVHLGMQYRLCPTHYTLKNCTINPGHALHNWVLEASNNGDEWDTLREHVNDTRLAPSRGSFCTWEIPGCKTSYNRFRIRITGPNQHLQSIAVFHYLMLSGMELYGYMNKLSG